MHTHINIHTHVFTHHIKDNSNVLNIHKSMFLNKREKGEISEQATRGHM